VTPVRHHFAAMPQTAQDPSTADDLAVGARALVVVDGEVPGGLVTFTPSAAAADLSIARHSVESETHDDRRGGLLESPNCHKPFGNEVGSNSVE
jgi:hypothetical protein